VSEIECLPERNEVRLRVRDLCERLERNFFLFFLLHLHRTVRRHRFTALGGRRSARRRRAAAYLPNISRQSVFLHFLKEMKIFKEKS
jgi:hypothetical protein